MPEAVAPPRPDVHPDKWITCFYYTDSYGPPGLSRVTTWDTKDQAVSEADNARRQHDGGGVKVQMAYAYPPVGSQDQPHVVDFQRTRI